MFSHNFQKQLSMVAVILCSVAAGQFVVYEQIGIALFLALLAGINTQFVFNSAKKEILEQLVKEKTDD